MDGYLLNDLTTYCRWYLSSIHPDLHLQVHRQQRRPLKPCKTDHNSPLWHTSHRHSSQSTAVGECANGRPEKAHYFSKQFCRVLHILSLLPHHKWVVQLQLDYTCIKNKQQHGYIINLYILFYPTRHNSTVIEPYANFCGFAVYSHL